jgi:Lactonase, 7-bladed beta-propeller
MENLSIDNRSKLSRFWVQAFYLPSVDSMRKQINSAPQEKAMRRTNRRLAISFLAAVSTLSPAILQAQQYIYTNDNIQFNSGNNSTTAYKVSSTGTVTAIKTYPTGGLGSNGSYFAQIEIASAQTSSQQCLFVADGYGNDVAAFTIKMADGTLKKVAGSPFASGGSSGGRGIGLAVSNTSGQPLLFAGNPLSNTITAFVIKPNCTLKRGKTVSAAGSPIGLKATPDGKYLLTAYLGQVDSFQIKNAKGNLVELGPFSADGATAGVEISCDSSTAYFGDASSEIEVDMYSINSAGKLAEINNFTNTNAVNSNNVLLSVDGKTLFVSNTMSVPPAITTLTVGSGGALTYDSTTSLQGSAEYALGLAATKSGKKLFVVETNNNEDIGVLKTKGTKLTEVPGSPFPGTQNGFISFSLTAVPGKSCK